MIAPISGRKLILYSGGAGFVTAAAGERASHGQMARPRAFPPNCDSESRSPVGESVSFLQHTVSFLRKYILNISTLSNAQFYLEEEHTPIISFVL